MNEHSEILSILDEDTRERVLGAYRYLNGDQRRFQSDDAAFCGLEREDFRYLYGMLKKDIRKVEEDRQREADEWISRAHMSLLSGGSRPHGDWYDSEVNTIGRFEKEDKERIEKCVNRLRAFDPQYEGCKL